MVSGACVWRYAYFLDNPVNILKLRYKMPSPRGLSTFPVDNFSKELVDNWYFSVDIYPECVGLAGALYLQRSRKTGLLRHPFTVKTLR